MTGRDVRWMRRALRTASTEARGGYRLGAVAVRGGKHLGTGANRWRNDPYRCPGVPREAWSVHAEQVCLRNVTEAEGATLYVARITPGGQPAMARPCPTCWQQIEAAGIARVVYTTEGGGAAVERVNQRPLAA